MTPEFYVVMEIVEDFTCSVFLGPGLVEGYFLVVGQMCNMILSVTSSSDFVQFPSDFNVILCIEYKICKMM